MLTHLPNFVKYNIFFIWFIVQNEINCQLLTSVWTPGIWHCIPRYCLHILLFIRFAVPPCSFFSEPHILTKEKLHGATANLNQNCHSIKKASSFSAPLFTCACILKWSFYRFACLELFWAVLWDWRSHATLVGFTEKGKKLSKAPDAYTSKEPWHFCHWAWFFYANCPCWGVRLRSHSSGSNSGSWNWKDTSPRVTLLSLHSWIILNRQCIGCFAF